MDEAAAELGRELARAGTDAADVRELLAHQGFDPYDDGGVIRLRNCPFRQLAEEHTDLVCSMNLALLDGVVDGSSSDLHVALEPGSGRCCVALRDGR